MILKYNSDIIHIRRIKNCVGVIKKFKRERRNEKEMKRLSISKLLI